MGKKLIIKGADFSANAITDANYYIPQTVINATRTTFVINQTFIFEDDANELSGITITGFDLLFVNKCSGQTMGIEITFNPETEQEIKCSVVCDFETQDESEQKIIHYDLSEPYTFKEHDVLHMIVTDATYVESGNTRGGCTMFLVDRPDEIPNFAFLLVRKKDSLYYRNVSFQPFMKLYL